MTKIIISLVVVFSQIANAQNYYSRQLAFAQRIAPTPQHSIELLSSVLPESDIKEIKSFFSESNISLTEKLSEIKLEDGKIYLQGLSEPISVTKEGFFEFKGTKFRYNKNVSFKKNLDAFEKSWGQFKEFAKPKKVSFFNHFLITEAHAEDGVIKKVVVVLMAIAAAFPLLITYISLTPKFGPDAQQKQMIKSLTPKISCNPDRFQLDGLDIQIQTQSSTTVNALKCFGTKKESYGCSSLLTFNKIMDAEGKTHLKLKASEKLHNKLHKNDKSIEMDGQTLEQIAEETLAVCKSGNINDFNKHSEEVAKYLVKNKMVKTKYFAPFIPTQSTQLPISTPSPTSLPGGR